jgi:hypothetical protein
MPPEPSLTRTREAQEALNQIKDSGTHVFASMMHALIVRRAFGDERIATDMNIDSYFLIKVFEEYFSDRDAIYKALTIGDGRDG